MILHTWNLGQGDAHGRLAPTMAAIRSHGADVVVLTGYRPRPMAPLREALCEAGWPWYVDTAPPGEKATGIAILGREGTALEAVGEILVRSPHRWCEVLVPRPFLRVLAVHVPSAREDRDKAPFWEAVIHYARERRHDAGVIIGDFSTGEVDGLAFKYPEYLKTLLDLGWYDAYRHFHSRPVDPTWHDGTGRGFRVDYAFVSALAMPRLARAWHSHAEREIGCSDHSSLLIELS